MMHVEAIRHTLAKLFRPDDIEKAYSSFDMLANKVIKRFYFVFVAVLAGTIITFGAANCALFFHDYNIYFYIFSFFELIALNTLIHAYLNFSNSRLARKIYDFDLPPELIRIFDQLKKEHIRVYAQLMKPYSHYEALRAYCPETDENVTLEYILTSEAFSSKLLPLLLSSRRRDWGFCLVKAWRSLSRAPLYVEIASSSKEKTAKPLPRHWRHEVPPEHREPFCDALIEAKGWSGHKAIKARIALMAVLEEPGYVGAGKNNIESAVKLADIACAALQAAKSRGTIDAIWFADQKDQKPDESLQKIFSHPGISVWREKREIAFKKISQLTKT